MDSPKSSAPKRSTADPGEPVIVQNPGRNAAAIVGVPKPRGKNSAAGRWANKTRDRAQLAIVDVDEPIGWTTDDWATPWEFVRGLEKEFGRFFLDPCASFISAKADHFYTLQDDGLHRPWLGGPVFMNPPYSQIAQWLDKAHQEAQGGLTVVCLIPVRTDQDWWHDKVLGRAELRFLRGRLHFIGKDGTTIGRPVFASALAIYRARS
jgi:phage N-6-adenine-methyltransferase